MEDAARFGRKHMIKKCRICGNATKRDAEKFCSRKCYGIWQSRNSRGKESHGWKGGKIKKICQGCGKELNITPALAQDGKKKFCSSKCWGKWRDKRIEKTCQICGRKFKVKSSIVKKGNGKLCSLRCHGIHTSQRQLGENNPIWKGGITPVLYAIRNSSKYQDRRQQIFLRDNFTCQKCKQKGGRLQAHHKKPFSKLIEEIKFNLPLLSLYEAAMIYIPLWDTNNGTTLCEKCHIKPGRNKENI